MHLHSPARTLLLSALAAAAACAPAQAAAPCAGADLVPGSVPAHVTHGAVRCLLNAERRWRRLRPLARDRRLERAAQLHARDLVRRGYFAHESPEGAGFAARIFRTGYVSRRASGWLLGENLAWGAGPASAPAAVVCAWMRSPGHRANVLEPGFRELGVAVVPGDPAGAARAGSATYAAELGRRSGSRGRRSGSRGRRRPAAGATVLFPPGSRTLSAGALRPARRLRMLVPWNAGECKRRSCRRSRGRGISWTPSSSGCPSSRSRPRSSCSGTASSARWSWG